MTDEFDPARFKDEYREALMSVIQAKIDGVEVAEPEPVEESANLVDLMKLLQASVKQATDEKSKASPPPVSVADAKKERAGRSPAAAATKAPAASRSKAAAKAKAEADADAEADAEAETKPARRRKSA
jgi:DNA end-binding protein Ku